MADTSAPAPPTRRLHRSNDDRVIAGVCGGLAEYTAIDPIVFRIGFAVATIAGGAGLLAYVLAWALIPEEGRDGPDWASPALVVGAIAVALVVGLPLLFTSAIFGHTNFGWVVPVVILVLIFSSPRRRYWRSYDRWHRQEWRRRNQSPWWEPTSSATGDAPPPPPPAPGATAADASASSATTTAAASAGPPPFWPPPPAWARPAPPPPLPPLPPRPRESSRLGRLTLSAALIVGGVLAAVDTSDSAHVSVATVLASVLLVVAAGLLVGSLFGRAHWLIAIGIPLSIITLAATSAPGGGVGEREWHPIAASDLQRHYRLTVGHGILDLSDLTAFNGTRRVDVDLGIGELSVTVPTTVAVDVTADVGAGDVTIDRAITADGSRGFQFGRDNGRRERAHYDGTGPGRLVLDLHVGMGHIEVSRSGVLLPSDREWMPTSVAELQPTYDVRAGDAQLDLRRLHDVTGEESTRVDVGAGDIHVILPTDVDVDVIASSGAGRIDLAGHDPVTGPAVDERAIYDTSGTGRLVLTLHTGVGNVEVTR